MRNLPIVGNERTRAMIDAIFRPYSGATPHPCLVYDPSLFWKTTEGPALIVEWENNRNAANFYHWMVYEAQKELQAGEYLIVAYPLIHWNYPWNHHFVVENLMKNIALIVGKTKLYVLSGCYLTEYQPKSFTKAKPQLISREKAQELLNIPAQRVTEKSGSKNKKGT